MQVDTYIGIHSWQTVDQNNFVTSWSSQQGFKVCCFTWSLVNLILFACSQIAHVIKVHLWITLFIQKNNQVVITCDSSHISTFWGQRCQKCCFFQGWGSPLRCLHAVFNWSAIWSYRCDPSQVLSANPHWSSQNQSHTCKKPKPQLILLTPHPKPHKPPTIMVTQPTPPQKKVHPPRNSRPYDQGLII